MSRRIFSTLPLLWLASIGSLAMANVINQCIQGTSTGGTMNSCTFNNNTLTFTGEVKISETFTSNAPNMIGIGLFLTNTIAGNNIAGIFDYTITKVIANNTGSNWYDFTVTDGVGAASAFGPVILISGFTSCTTPSGTSFFCSGGFVPNGGTLMLQYHQSTPLDQSSGAMEIFESPTTIPEPASVGISGLGLIAVAAAVYRRRIYLPRV